jgi:hypothetical protein
MQQLKIILFVISACTLVGCGDGRPTRVTVAGKVVIDGQPLKFGSVRFVPNNGRASVGQLDQSGAFTLMCFYAGDGALLGKHQVEVNAGEQVSSNRIRWHAPKKYSHFSTSGLTQEIAGPTDSVLIELAWDGGKPYTETEGTEAGNAETNFRGRTPTDRATAK